MGGRTAHSTLKIPLKLNDTSTCSIYKQSHWKGLIQKASLVIWDEALMTHRHAFEAVDRSLRDLMDNDDEPFGGKVFVLSGDFRQILLVVVRGTRAQTPLNSAYAVLRHEINALMQRYVVWAESQWPDCKVIEVLTDGGGEFLNGSNDVWYQQHGITHTVTPNNVSRLNMVERTHKTLQGMLKTMMKDSGFPTSFWVEALYYAVYLKNRSFSSATNCTPYEEMWGRRPDILYVRKFGALAYVHTKVGPSRHKFADNCRIEFVLGYRDGTLGCKVYFPPEGSVQVAGQVTVNEQILYKDRHHNDFDRRVRDWAIEEHPDLTSTGRRDYVLPVVEGSGDGDAVDNGSPQPTAR
ncbi:hypothetical protein PC128_g21092 [Phytophthora cactorum]|nr:hypothetical protein PC120_g25312 [Phytophthora cactorum]KAG3160447.1 hypothetical protein PC128_g21092 [Phytophthora cactorum]KAG4038348.1 hypothetical protein PC123_g26091 [Phytophthora cactorum]